MNYGQYIFSLELNNPNSQIALSAKRTDTGRKLHINLTHNGEPYLITDECWVLFMATKSDGTQIVHECSVVNNVVEYELQEQTVASIGVMNCAIAVYGTVNNVAKKLESAMFNIVVYDGSIDIDEITSSDDYQAFIAATGELKALMNECETLLNTYAAQQDNIQKIVSYNSINLLDTISNFSIMENNVKYSWYRMNRTLTMTALNSNAASFEFGTIDLSSAIISGRSLTLSTSNTNPVIKLKYEILDLSGNKTSAYVENEAVIYNNSLKSITLYIEKLQGFTGTFTFQLEFGYGKSHSELLKEAKNYTDEKFEEIGGGNGKSAYEIWLEQGNEGTEADFIAALKGKDGTSVTVTEVVSSTDDGGINIVYFSDGSTFWVRNGTKGSTGTPGRNGADGAHGMSTYELWLAEGNTGEVEDFLASLKGDKGDKPVKGEDYFTESDKAKLVTDVLEALPTWEGGSF